MELSVLHVSKPASVTRRHDARRSGDRYGPTFGQGEAGLKDAFAGIEDIGFALEDGDLPVRAAMRDYTRQLPFADEAGEAFDLHREDVDNGLRRLQARVRKSCREHVLAGLE